MKKILLLIFLFPFFKLNAICKRDDKAHTDQNVVRCLYTQEDIYRCYSKKLHCYGAAERCKECFYCGCPIEEHSKKEVPSKKSDQLEKNLKKPVIKRDLRKRR